MSDRVLFSAEDDGVGVVSLNRPDKLNAMDAAVFEGLTDAAAQAATAIADGAVRAVLLRGEGRAFSAGLDISMFGAQIGGDKPSDEDIAALQRSFTGFEDLDVPVIAAVQGAALGGGCQLALAADLRVVADDLKIGLLELNWAIIPDLGGLTRLPRLIGASRTMDLAMTARTIDAETAMAWGMADRVVPAAELQDTARQMAAQLAAGPTLALGAIPAVVRGSFTRTRDESLAAERAAQRACLDSADLVEAATAAMQRRPPSFTGR